MPDSTAPADNDTAPPRVWWSPSMSQSGRVGLIIEATDEQVSNVDPWPGGSLPADAVRLVPAPAVAVPAETRDAPHDPAHLMYDADTGVCLDCDRIVDPIAAPVAAAFPAAMRAYQDAAEFTEAEDAERVVTAILRAAFRTALKGTS